MSITVCAQEWTREVCPLRSVVCFDLLSDKVFSPDQANTSVKFFLDHLMLKVIDASEKMVL